MLGRRTSFGPDEVTPVEVQLIEGRVMMLLLPFTTVLDGIVTKYGEELKFKWVGDSVLCSGELRGFAAS